MATADSTATPARPSDEAVLAGGALVAAATAVGAGWLLSAGWFVLAAVGLSVVEGREWADNTDEPKTES